jgi:hypothetical protein
MAYEISERAATSFAVWKQKRPHAGAGRGLVDAVCLFGGEIIITLTYGFVFNPLYIIILYSSNKIPITNATGRLIQHKLPLGPCIT